NHEAHCFRNAEVNHEYVTRRLLERQVARLCSFENAIHQGARSLKEFLAITSIGHQTACANVRFALIYGGQAVVGGIVEYPLSILKGVRGRHTPSCVRRAA